MFSETELRTKWGRYADDGRLQWGRLKFAMRLAQYTTNMFQQPEPPVPDSGPLLAAFLVRCWQGGYRWHFILENVITRERHAFADLDGLCAYIQHVLEEDGS